MQGFAKRNINTRSHKLTQCAITTPLSVTHMLDYLQWPLLSQLRSCLRLVFLYKIEYQIVAIPPDLYIFPKQILGLTNIHSCLSYVTQTPTATVFFSQQQYANKTLSLTILLNVRGLMMTFRKFWQRCKSAVLNT